VKSEPAQPVWRSAVKRNERQPSSWLDEAIRCSPLACDSFTPGPARTSADSIPFLSACRPFFNKPHPLIKNLVAADVRPLHPKKILNHSSALIFADPNGMSVHQRGLAVSTSGFRLRSTSGEVRANSRSLPRRKGATHECLRAILSRFSTTLSPAAERRAPRGKSPFAPRTRPFAGRQWPLYPGTDLFARRQSSRYVRTEPFAGWQTPWYIRTGPFAGRQSSLYTRTNPFAGWQWPLYTRTNPFAPCKKALYTCTDSFAPLPKPPNTPTKPIETN